MADSAVKFVVVRLGEFVVREAALLQEVGNDVMLLKDKLQWLQAFVQLADHERRHGSSAYKDVWVQQTREVALEVEDVLDEFMLRVNIESALPLWNKSLRFLSSCATQISFRHDLSGRIAMIRARLDQISQHSKDYIKDHSPPPAAAKASPSITTTDGWYLCIRSSILVEFPSTIANLINLQTLDIQKNRVQKVTQAFWKIPTLRHVLAENLPLPKSVGVLKNLQTLRGMVCGHPWRNNISPLHNMVNLRRLEISELKAHHWGALSDSFKKLDSLVRLHLSAKEDAIPITLFTRFSLSHLQVLELHGVIEMGHEGSEEPFALPNLSWLLLKSSMVNQDFMNKLGKLPRLAELVLSDKALQMEELVFSCGESGFGNLTDLVLRNLSELVECKIGPKSLPKVKNIEVVNCTKMKREFEGEHVLKSLGEFEVEENPGNWRWRAVP